MNNQMTLELSALSENESFARSAVAAFALPLRPSFSELSDIKTAVSEAVTNSIVHAYDGGREGAIVKIVCRLVKAEEGGELQIDVVDFGKGIADVSQALQPFFTTLSGEERSGMGFTVMQTFMSDFCVTSERGKGTRVSLMKRIVGENEERV